MPPVLTRRAFGLISLATLLSNVPYLIAWTMPEAGAEFGGFLLNPVDGFSYLAKMGQGGSGAFEFTLPYAAEPGPGAALFVFHLALGWLAYAIGASPLLIYHLARVVGTILMFSAAHLLYARAFETRAAGRWAFVLVLFGSGLGWLGALLGLPSIDLHVPEAVPFLTAYTNAHFPIASAAMLLVISLVAFDDLFSRLKIPLAFAAGFLLGITQPFTILSIGIALIGWILVENRTQLSSIPRTRRLHISLTVFAGAAPILLYDYLSTRVSAELSAWAAQNATPTPGLPAVLLGYGVVLPLVVVALWRRRDEAWGPATRLLLIWAVSGALLLYAPIALQRRFALGLFFPLAGLAAVGIESLRVSVRNRRLLLALALALSLPSHVFVIAAGMTTVAQQDQTLTLLAGERTTYQWIDQNTPPYALILAGPIAGNRIPAFSSARVLYGHPFETPNAPANEQLVAELFSWTANASKGVDRLRSIGVDYVVYGPEERGLGSPSWLAELQLVFEQLQYQVFQVDGS
jgi:hypothetical protein